MDRTIHAYGILEPAQQENIYLLLLHALMDRDSLLWREINDFYHAHKATCSTIHTSHPILVSCCRIISTTNTNQQYCHIWHFGYIEGITILGNFDIESARKEISFQISSKFNANWIGYRVAILGLGEGVGLVGF